MANPTQWLLPTLLLLLLLTRFQQHYVLMRYQPPWLSQGDPQKNKASMKYTYLTLVYFGEYISFFIRYNSPLHEVSWTIWSGKMLAVIEANQTSYTIGKTAQLSSAVDLHSVRTSPGPPLRWKYNQTTWTLSGCCIFWAIWWGALPSRNTEVFKPISYLLSRWTWPLFHV